jgi:predicted signal transduction protein with EAL and GGDEF domain
MIAWLVRILVIVSGFMASWFVTKDSPQFAVMQMAVILLVVVLIVAVLAFWPERWTHILNRTHPKNVQRAPHR